MSRLADQKRRIESLRRSIAQEKAKDSPRWDMIAMWENRIELLYWQMEKDAHDASAPVEADPPPQPDVWRPDPSPPKSSPSGVAPGGESSQERYEEVTEQPPGGFHQEYTPFDPHTLPEQASLIPADMPSWYVWAGVGLVALAFSRAGK